MKPSEYLNMPYTNQGEKLYRDVLKIQKLEKDAVDKYKEELKDKINKILNKFANATDIDGRETVYKYTDCDLADLRAEILELINK